MAKLVSSWLLLTRLAIADLCYDKKVSLCIIASIISVITPLLLLFSLKYGVVSQLRHQLIDDPQNLEVKIVGNLQLKTDMFTWLAEQPEVEFVIPLTRSLNTQADLIKNSSHFANNVEIIPTAKNDPVTKNLPLLTSQYQVILSALAAEKMKLKQNDTIKIIITRQLDGNIEKGMRELEVVGILPENQYTRSAAFVTLALLIDMENFYDGYRSESFPTATGLSDPPEHSTFARARIYASALENVALLALKLRNKNIETRTQANAIENMQAIDRVLGFIFAIIALTSILGCILSLTGAFLSNIERKRKDIAFMRLLGFKSRGIMTYLILQAMLLSCISFIMSCLLFLAGNSAFNNVLGKNLVSQPMVSQLQFYHLVIAFIFTLFISGLVVAIGGRRAVKIQPAESLREI